MKGNQPTLHERLKAFFLDHLGDDFARIEIAEHPTKETKHGRHDERSYYLCKAPEDLPDAAHWEGFRAIGISINDTARRQGDEIAVRYYILSKTLSGEEFTVAVRNH